VAVGCGGATNDDANGASSGALTEGDFRAQFPPLACAGLETCCREAGFGYDASLCQALSTPVPTPGAIFDPEAAADCLETLRNTQVDCSTGASIPECDAVYTGTVEEGGGCSSDSDCLVPDDGTATCQFGRCATVLRGAEGDPCTQSCQAIGTDGWACSGSGSATGDDGQVQCWREDGLACSGDTCTPLGAPGAACSVDQDCQDDAYCDQSTCRKRAKSGTACTSSSECALGTYCDGTCTPQSAEGQSCSADEQCLGGSCSGSCDVDDPLGGLGQALLGLLCGG
jgi:hypothetical protein